jgi:hypothetical protein
MSISTAAGTPGFPRAARPYCEVLAGPECYGERVTNAVSWGLERLAAASILARAPGARLASAALWAPGSAEARPASAAQSVPGSAAARLAPAKAWGRTSPLARAAGPASFRQLAWASSGPRRCAGPGPVSGERWALAKARLRRPGLAAGHARRRPGLGPGWAGGWRRGRPSLPGARRRHTPRTRQRRVRPGSFRQIGGAHASRTCVHARAGSTRRPSHGIANT